LGARRAGVAKAGWAFDVFRMISGTDITVWTISALIAVGIGLSKYSKYKTRDKLVRDLAAMDPERREKVLSRLQPDLQMEIRQELMKRFRLKTDI
jgi:hypothetical protein